MTFTKYKYKVLQDIRSKKLDFISDGRLHYVYRVTELFQDGRHYYGSRTECKITIGHNYFTSSKDRDFCISFKEKTDNYKIKIIKIFDNPDDKMLFESYLHQKFNVKDNDNFINRANQTPFGFDTTGKQIGLKSPVSKKILQIDTGTGEVIKEWNTITMAANFVNRGVSNLTTCAKGTTKISGGFNWCYPKNYNNSYKKSIVNYNFTAGRNIYQIDLKTGKIIKEWENAVTAGKRLKIHHNQISSCTRGVALTAGKFAWCYIENYTKEFAQKITNPNYLKRKGKPIIQLDKDTNQIIKIWDSTTKACDCLNLRNPGLSLCLHNKIKQSGGYNWEFVVTK